MDVREHDLPGVGKKYAVRTRDGTRMTVIIHNTGHRELYHFRQGEDFPFYAVRLDDDDARQLGAILGGAYFQPPVAESMDMILDQLSIEWFRVDASSPLAGHTIGEADIRQRTGASIIAILHQGKAHPNPQPTDTVAAGDTLVVVGDRDQVTRFASLVRAAPIASR
ncbi:MAG TPA: cation:proton antiporter regulatory subunit [Gemmatimonadaceae bacterium]|nr:cation:proton antiporter regulatory subunit [Gemmatimonadaceae bacterium]